MSMTHFFNKKPDPDPDTMFGSIRQMRSDRAKLDELANPPLVAWRANFTELGNMTMEQFETENVYCFPQSRDASLNREWLLPLPLLNPMDANFPSRLEMMTYAR